MKRITDIKSLLCRSDATAREVLARINSATPYLFQIVVDKKGRLVGTVTDGDMRRALLHGASLDDPARSCMHYNPTAGRSGNDKENIRRLESIGSARAFLPVVDASRMVKEVLVSTSAALEMPAVLVMAGGLGTRLGERTRHTPKPMLKVGSRPILDHVLRGLEAAGVTEIYISVHYLADRITEFLTRRRSRAKIHVIRESERMGTAGALAKLPKKKREGILVINGDVITRTNYAALVSHHHRHGHDGTIAVARHDVQVPFGVINYGPDGSFSGISEKPRMTFFIAAGIYYLSAEFLALVRRNRPLDMPELLNRGRKMGLHIAPFPIHEYWIDVGRPEDLLAADRAHRRPTA